MSKNYVIIKNGSKYVVKEKIGDGFFGLGLYVNKDLDKVKEFASKNFLNVVAIGDIWEV